MGFGRFRHSGVEGGVTLGPPHHLVTRQPSHNRWRVVGVSRLLTPLMDTGVMRPQETRQGSGIKNKKEKPPDKGKSETYYKSPYLPFLAASC